MIVCAGNEELFDFAYPIGVGLVESAINLARACLFDKPRFILFVGSAGSYGEYAPFDIVQSRGASQIELSFWDNRSYTPLDNVVMSEGLNVSHETLVNSSNYITIDSRYWERFNSHGIGAENMEFFSVMRVAQEFGVPAGGVFVITNYCDKDAHRMYRENIAKGKKILEKVILERLKR